ncbi:MAG: SDR family oxidoreductase [Acaryochloridaceae cyanobacterium SU_2_1]|nr:SDR family oxidoreductase [Acaryochloridaceae cyanobacterium SU_2_1]NJM95224.1 SDR family oxidoreductase [Acaryochloridaceae cyanobacterium CSU_5_19]
MKAFVAGATGETGRRIVSQLVERGFAVKALVRDRTKAKALLSPDVELVVGDILDASSFNAAIADCTVVLCATGAAPGFNPFAPLQIDYLGTKNLVDVAKTHSIQQFVFVSSLCTSKLLHPLNLFFLVLVWKKQAEEYLRNSGLTYTIVRPGGLKNEDNDYGIVMSVADSLLEGSIPRTKVAQVCIEALLVPAAQNKIIEIVAAAEAKQRPVSELFANV